MTEKCIYGNIKITKIKRCENEKTLFCKIFCFSYHTFCLFRTTNSQGSAFAVEKPKTETSFSDTIEVLSYVDVFEEYYDLAKEEIIGNIGIMPFTFEQYCEGYYSYNYSIEHYTHLVVE